MAHGENEHEANGQKKKSENLRFKLWKHWSRGPLNDIRAEMGVRTNENVAISMDISAHTFVHGAS